MPVDEANLVARLAELTGSLVPLEGTAPAALERARRRLTEALLHPQAEPLGDTIPGVSTVSAEELPGAALDELRRIVQEVVAAPRDPDLRVFRRAWPLLAAPLPQSLATWANGWKPREAIGPFESPQAEIVWFDVRRATDNVVLVDLQTGRLWATLPRATIPADPTAIDVSDIEIPGGSVWFFAPLFDPNAPARSFAGMRIRGGRLMLSEPGLIHGRTIGVTAGSTVTLQLDLDHDERPPRTAHGGDVRSLSMSQPERVTFAFAGTAASALQISPATLEIYGDHVRLRHHEGSAARYDPRTGQLGFPMLPDRSSLSIRTALSQVFRPVGEAHIREAAWMLPVAVATSDGDPRFDEAQGAGALALSLAEGLSASLDPMDSVQPLALDAPLVLAEPDHLTVVASAGGTGYRCSIELWPGQRRGQSRMELRAAHDRLALRFDATTSSGGAEALAIGLLECAAQLDRPVTAAGRRVPFFSERGTLEAFRLASGARVFVRALADSLRDPVSGERRPAPDVSFGLANALVRASAVTRLDLGVLRGGSQQPDRGALVLQFGLRFAIPSLPDPYAANIAKQAPRQLLDAASRAPGLSLSAHVRWGTASEPEVAFALAGAGALPIAQNFLPIENPPIEHNADPRRQRDYLAEVESRFPRASGQGGEFIRMLDVSSRADLFGVGLSAAVDRAVFDAAFTPAIRAAPLRLRGLDLIAPVRNVSAFTLPAFHWEPVFDIPSGGALPFPPRLASATDGGPSRFATPAVSLVPVAPLPVIDSLVAEYNRPEGSLAVRFTLPFGIVAAAQLVRRPREPETFTFDTPVFGNLRPDFRGAGLQGGQQLMLQAPAHLITALGLPPPGLLGAAVQTDNGTTGRNVLDSGSVDEFFNLAFADKAPRVPIQRIDFSGYGASTFSDWRHPPLTGAGVVQVKFEAVVGRTAREVVQVKSKLVPWGIVVVRTITLERTGSGGVFRRDSGWQAASDAEYNLPGCVVHPGVVRRLRNIRRIRDTTNLHERVYPTGPDGGNVKLVQVIFDAEAQVEGVTRGANASGLIPVRDIVGYVQIRPQGGPELLDYQIADLLAATGPLGGPIEGEINIGQSGLHMRLSRIEVDRTTTLANTPQFVAVARGTAEVAGAGQWTFAYRGISEPEPHRLAADQPIPLVRANPNGGAVAPYRFADASELHRIANPETEYSLLHSTGAQRLLVPQPQIRSGDPNIHGGSALLFADIYTLSGAVGLFPRPDQCHPLPGGSVLRITGRGKLRLDVPQQAGLAAGEFAVGPLERTLSQGAVLRVRSRFRPQSTIRLAIDSDQDPDWSCSYGPVSVIGDINELDELMQVVGTMSSSAHARPEVRNPQIVFGSVLAPLQAVVDFLTAFGFPKPFDVSVTNPKFAFKSSIHYEFPGTWPFSAIDDALKHGVGVMLELELKASFGKESENLGEALVTSGFPPAGALTPWVFGLEYSSKLLVRALPPFPVFLGGVSRFEVEGRSDGKESKLAFFGGFGGAVEADLKAVEVSGERHYSICSRIVQENGEVKVGQGVCTGWEVGAAFLEGLAEVKLSFEMLVIMERGNEFHCVGEATLAIDITVAWCVSKTFEAEVTMNEQLAIAAFVASTVLPS